MIPDALTQFAEMALRFDPETTAVDLAEILWLASRLPASAVSGPAPSVGSGGDPGGRGGVAPPSGESGARTDAAARTPLYAGAQRADTEPGESVRAAPIRSPAGRALPGALELGRALRPLMRRVASDTERELDVEATVDRIAQGRLAGQPGWQPVVRPKREPWLEVALVIDDAPSMLIWRDTLIELEGLLRQGVFRDVRVWSLSTEGAGVPKLSRRSGRGPGDRVGHNSALLRADGRRLILVCSDCVASGWQLGTGGVGSPVWTELASWGTKCPLSVVQMLPFGLWERTSLYDRRMAAVRALAPARSNRSLAVEASVYPAAHNATDSAVGAEGSPPVPVPVVTLEAEPLAYWARALAGLGADGVPGALVALSMQETRRGRTSVTRRRPSRSAERLWAQFQTASPEARLLAAYLAAVPLSLPVMRTVQEVMFREPRQSHLAEVLLSGLVNRLVTRGRSLNASHDVLFDFLPGIRKRLRHTVRESETVRVIRRMCEHFEREFGQRRDAEALYPHPAGTETLLLTVETLPFAEVAAETLRELGGIHAQAGEELKQSIAAARSRIMPPEPISIDPRHVPELIAIPAGEFLMGSEKVRDSDAYPDEQPQHRVYLSAYSIYKTPVTVGQYLAFCAATGYPIPEAPDFNLKWEETDHPIVNVSWNDAVAYCAWQSEVTGRVVTLPTEAQWEKAARGTDGRIYPWGNEWDASRCANSVENKKRKRGTASVDSFASGASPYGVLDMAGNVYEWCSDWFWETYYTQCAKRGRARNPRGPAKGTYRVLRGGSWDSYTPDDFRCACRSTNQPGGRLGFVGFRCVVRSDTA